jgi:hypothetical protein
VSLVQIVDSFFDGVPPEGADYFYRNNVVETPAGLVAGLTLNIITYKVPDFQVLDLSGLEFYIHTGGPTPFTDYPDDTIRGIAFFRIRKNEQQPWFSANDTPAANQDVEGYDLLNRNVLAMWGAAPIHMIFGPSSLLTVDLVVVNTAVQLPNKVFVGARINGRQVTDEVFRKVVR